MLNLAIECSGHAGSVAVLRQQDLLAQRFLPPSMGSVQSLTPAIAELLCLLSSQRVDLISITVGPGSFTGLRAGLATAKMLAFAWKISIAPVDTLHAIAYQAAGCWSNPTATTPGMPPTGRLVVPVLNAFRKQVFTSAWLTTNGHTGMHHLSPAQVVDASVWQKHPVLSQQFPESEQAKIASTCPILSGPGLRTYPNAADFACELAPEQLWDPTAATVGQIGWHHFQAGLAVTAQQLLPRYGRASAAEEATSKQTL